MKKLLILFLALLLLIPLALPSYAAAPEANEAEEALLYCFHTDSVLFAKNADKRIAHGNTAQLMTSLLTLEAYPDLLASVTLTEDLLPGWYAPGDYRTLADYGFKKGAEVPVKDLLAAMVIENANCASLLLASLIAGSKAEFVNLMNARAAELGMTNTVYKNPTGDDAEGAYTTANDLLILAKLLYHNPEFMALASASSYLLIAKNSRIYTRNYFLGKWYTDAYLYPNADGMKAGYTDEAENTLVATATESDGYTYLAIILGGKEINFQNTSYALAKSLFRFGSTSFSYREVLSSAKLVTTLSVNGGDGADKVPLFPKETVRAYLPKTIDDTLLTIDYHVIRESIDAPFEKGTVVGEITIYYDQNVIGKTELVTGNGAKRAQNATLKDRLETLVKPILIVTALAIALVLVRYALTKLQNKKNPKE